MPTIHGDVPSPSHACRAARPGGAADEPSPPRRRPHPRAATPAASPPARRRHAAPALPGSVTGPNDAGPSRPGPTPRRHGPRPSGRAAGSDAPSGSWRWRVRRAPGQPPRRCPRRRSRTAGPSVTHPRDDGPAGGHGTRPRSPAGAPRRNSGASSRAGPTCRCTSSPLSHHGPEDQVTRGGAPGRLWGGPRGLPRRAPPRR